MTSSNLADLVAPGQEELLENIVEEIEAEDRGEGAETPEQVMEEGGEEELIGGKFKSQEDLLNAYKELEKKQSEGSNEEPEQKWEYEDVKPEEYTEEIGEKIYGKGLTDSFTAAEINPLEMAEKVYAGEDVTEYVNALVEKGGLPEGAVVTYLSGIAGSAYEKKGGAAVETPEPLEETPGHLSKFHGFFGTSLLGLYPAIAPSVRFNLPKMIAPADFNFDTTVAS